jgi:hypothetical protein
MRSTEESLTNGEKILSVWVLPGFGTLIERI